MKKSFYIILFTLISLFAVEPAVADNKTTDPTNKKERAFIKQGNKYYNDKRYSEAEVEYRKALQANGASMIGSYNLALSLIRQDNGSKADSKNSPISQATNLLEKVAKSSKSIDLQAKAFYNLGNIAFNQKEYAKSIEYYKNSLRRNPDDDQARDNLRLAQLKKQQQDKGGKNNKNNKDKKKDDKDKNKQDQNKDKQNKDKQNNNNNQNKQQQKQQSGMSQNNIEQTLKTMQDNERATQQKVNAAKAKDKEASQRRTGNQW
jgi:Ca-activated chloride channel homolog